ncbi:MAG: tetratricopeptide repeat protein [Treponema sp.]|jgi:tetratricopeptide (TPR) repeat protein|nr:tetratricopeptide repeat protein [Treponema sp.]
MKKVKYSLLLLMLLVLAGGCASGGKPADISNLVSLEQALAAAAAGVSSQVSGQSGGKKAVIAVTGLDAPLSEVSDFITDELLMHFVNGGKFDVVERNKTFLAVLNAEHKFQMSGLVSDESAVGIGHYLGAKVMITGSFTRFAGFSQLRLRALDVETAKILSMYETRIHPNDTVLASVMRPLDGVNAPVISEKALAHLNRGEDLLRAGKYDKALREFDRALAIKELAEGYFWRGTAYLLKSDWDKAIANFTDAIKIKPDHAVALNNRGIAHIAKNNLSGRDQAIADFTVALSIDPDYTMALNNRGNVYALIKDDIDLAIADLNAALKINNYDVNVWRDLGIVFAIKGYYNMAMEYLDFALMIKPDDYLTLIYRGKLYYLNKRFDLAIADYTAALEIQLDFDTLYNRGKAYYERYSERYEEDNDYRENDYQRAIADYTAALKINPKSADVLRSRGDAYFVKGKDKQAIADYTAVLKIEPNDADTLCSRGEVYHDMGNYKQAIKDYEAVLRIDPNHRAKQYIENARQRRPWYWTDSYE